MATATRPALRGREPTTVEKRLKALFYGPAGVGKTTAAIQFPKPYVIDTERGAENDQYVKLINDRGGAYYFTTDPDDLIQEVTALLGNEHGYQTLIIDPLTVIYNDLTDRSAASLVSRDDPTGTAWGRHKIQPDRKIKHLLTLLLRLDMNVIITSHAKANWVESKDAKGNTVRTQDGYTFDCYPKLDYLFDLMFLITDRGSERIGTTTKSRVVAFPKGGTFPFGYDEIANRYGRDILERRAEPIELASPEQAAELIDLLETRTDRERLLEKWLDKAQAATIAEMPADSVAKCIAFLKGGAK